MSTQTARGYSVKKLVKRIDGGNIFEGINYKTKGVVDIIITNDPINKPPIKLNHKNLVKYIDTFEHGYRQWTIREHFSGITLTEHMRRELPLDEQIKLITEILEGLSYLHGSGLCHGRLSSDSIIITEDNNVKIIDYGQASDTVLETVVREDIVNLGRIGLRLTSGHDEESYLVDDGKGSIISPFGFNSTIQSFIRECLHPNSNTTTETLLSHGVILRGSERSRASSRLPLLKSSGEINSGPIIRTVQQTQYIGTPLHAACREGSVDKTVELLNGGVDPFAVDRYGYTPLHLAILGKHRDIVHVLLEAYKPVHRSAAPNSPKHIDYRTPDGKTGLQAACMFGCGEIAVLLLDEKANMEAVDSENKTPLHFATIYGHRDIVELLVEDGANKEAVDNMGNTPLLSGLFEGSFGSEDCVKSLIEYEANINHFNNLQQTPLYAAIHQRNKVIARILLEEGADVKYRNPVDDSSLLHTVCAVGLSNIIELLVKHIDINDRNAQDMTPLLYMILNFRIHKTPMELVVVIFRALISAGADLSIPDIHGNTLLHVIAEQNLGELLELLTNDFQPQLELVDVDLPNKEGVTCLELCFTKMELAYRNNDSSTFENYREMIIKLVDIGANINVKDDNGQTLLHRAILSENSVNTVKLLTELVAHPFLPDDTGKTAIHYAVKASAETTAYFFGSRPVQEIIKVWWTGHRRQLFVSFCIFLLSLAVYTAVCFYQTSRNRLSYSHTNLSLQNTILLSGPDNVGNSFEELLSRDDFWAWGSGVLIPTLYTPEGLAFNWLLDGARMVQYRVKPGSQSECDIPSALKDHNITCLTPFSKKFESIDAYGLDEQFKYSYVNTQPLSGQFSNFAEDGFVIDFHSTDVENYELWNNLQNMSWIDDNTRAVLIQFYLFNPYYNVFTQVQLLVEFPVMGAIATSQDIFTARLFPYVDSTDYFILFLELILVVYLVIYIADEIIELASLHYLDKRRILRVYLGDIWNAIDLLIIAVIFSVIVIRAQRVYLVYVTIDWNNISDHYNYLHQAFSACDAEVDFMALGMLFFWLKLLRFSPMVYPKMGLFISMMKFMIMNLGNFFFILFICVVGCAMATHILFGAEIIDFQTFGPSFITIINYLAGNSATDLLGTNNFMGPLMYIILLSVILIVLLNLLIAVLNSSYAEVEKEATTAWTREQAEILVDNLDKIDKFKLITKLSIFKKNKVNENLYKLQEPKMLVDRIHAIVDKYVSYRKFNQTSSPFAEESDGRVSVASQLEQLENTLQLVKTTMEKRFIKQSTYLEEKFNAFDETVHNIGTLSEANATSLAEIDEKIKQVDIDVRKIRILSMMRQTQPSTAKSGLSSLVTRQTAQSKFKERLSKSDDQPSTTTEPSKEDVEIQDIEHKQEEHAPETEDEVTAMLEKENPPVPRKKKLRVPGSFMEGTASSKARLRGDKKP